MKQLRECSLNCLKQDIPKAISALPSTITKLNLSRRDNFTRAHIRLIAKQLPNLSR